MCVVSIGDFSMSTTALNGNYQNYGFAPRPSTGDVRRVVREEIKRQKKLDELEAKYQAGEISKFEYNINKFVLNMPQELPDVRKYEAPCVEYMA